MGFLQIDTTTVTLINDYLGSVVILALASFALFLLRQMLTLYNGTITKNTEMYEKRLEREERLQAANADAINRIAEAVNNLNDNISLKNKLLETKIDNLKTLNK